jgi:hypothetical protein
MSCKEGRLEWALDAHVPTASPIKWLACILLS